MAVRYEIDFLPVGEGETSGDAIAFRFTLDDVNWFVGVIDGGTKDSGAKLCEHIAEYYDTNTVDLVICSHPDADHASGLTEVVENMDVRSVWMHRPWGHVEEIAHLITDQRVTVESLRQRLKDAFPAAWQIEEYCVANGVSLGEPFSDYDTGVPGLTILGPSRDFYLTQLPNFRTITEATEDESHRRLMEILKAAAKKVMMAVVEAWDDERLTDPADDATSAENNTSTVLLLQLDGKTHIFTGDAGTPALSAAADMAAASGISLQRPELCQVPHHGSKRNSGPTVLNRFIGTPVNQGVSVGTVAMISAAKDGEPKHPSKRVTNALNRRGAKVVATQGGTKLHCHNTGGRGWPGCALIPFATEYDEEDD